ncbi:hypothetical protein CMI47_00115 [Candidatus Pacearchaeota archaeon]|jgi:hypothetical protein|nr:hypothetical protein [Candidatus Pacearchaeota archaeon]|tara:strand:+ start:1357 stop:2427 length:1071 start_codon:yes stop_codon:yes gene_type:complete
MARNNAIQIRRGVDASVPTGSMVAGEPLFSTDNSKFYIATNANTKAWIGAAILDENNMASDSDTSLATQQSIKAYVDTQLDTQDALSELADTTIASLGTGHMLLYDGSDSWDNKAMSGDATINSSGVLTISTDAVHGTMINDDVAGDGLQISSNTLAVKVDDSSIETNSDTMRVKALGITNAMLAGSIANGKLSNSAITIADYGAANDGNSASSTSTALGGSMTFSGTDNEVTVAESSGRVTIGLPNNVTIAGNLTVSGDTVTTNVATVTVEDPLVAYASGNTGNAVDIGFYGKYRTNGTDLYLGLAWDADQTEFILFEGNQAVPSTTVNKSGTGFALSDLRLSAVHAATVDGGSY